MNHKPLKHLEALHNKRVTEVVPLHELMTDRDYDERYMVYFYEDKTFNVTSISQEKFLRETKQSAMYKVYKISVPGKKNLATLLSHRIVATYYHENPENKPEVNHIDGIKQNNHPDNLEWVTSRENTIHAQQTGLSKGLAGTHYRAKLTEQEVSIIYLRTLYNKSTRAECAEAYDISINAVGYICRKDSWKSVTEKPITVHIDALIKPLSELRTS